jgi:hypothetical protein
MGSRNLLILKSLQCSYPNYKHETLSLDSNWFRLGEEKASFWNSFIDSTKMQTVSDASLSGCIYTEKHFIDVLWWMGS